MVPSEEVKQQTNLRVNEVADIYRKPASRLFVEVCLAETIAGTVHSMRDMRDHGQSFIWIGSDCLDKDDKLVSLMAGTANTSLTLSDLETVSISFPSAAIQDAIIEVLDVMVGEVERTCLQADSVNRTARELVNDVLHLVAIEVIATHSHPATRHPRPRLQGRTEVAPRNWTVG
jgi:hypothetical protein